MNDRLRGEEKPTAKYLCAFDSAQVKILYKTSACTVIPALIHASVQEFMSELIKSMMARPSHDYSTAEVNCTSKSGYFSDHHSPDGD